MIINTLKDQIASPLHKAALYSFEKVSLCANSLFSFMKEEGTAWKSFFSNNYYISKLCTLGSQATASIGKKFFRSANKVEKDSIDLSNKSLEDLKSSNRAWIQDHSLFHKKYPDFDVCNEALLGVIFGKDVDNKEVIQFAKKFSSYTKNSSLSQSLSKWEKAYKQQLQIQKSRGQPSKIEQISRELSEKVQNFRGEKDHIILLFEKAPDTSNSPLSYYVEHGFNKIRSKHDALYQTVYDRVRKELQTHLNTNWKKKLFTEVQEEIRAILLNEYSALHQESTFGHNLANSLNQLLPGSVKLSAPKESLVGIVWDLLLQHGMNDASGQPVSKEKLNQIFEKEFEMIMSEIQSTAMSRINQSVDKAGKDLLQPLLQLWHNEFPQRERGWLEIKHESDTDCQVTLYARDRKNPAHNIRAFGEPSPMKVYSFKVPKHLLQAASFFELLNAPEKEDAPISSSETIKQFLSRYGKPTEAYIGSNSKLSNQGLLDHIKIYHLQNSEPSLESPEKTLFQMRLHAFINYCKSVEHNHNVSDEALLHVDNGVSALLESANKLYDAGELSDEECIEIISTGLEIEECVLEKQHKLRAGVQSSEIVVPVALKEQVRKMFASSGLSQLDVENIKNFARVLLGNDMSEEIALLCKELPISTDKQGTFTLPHVSLWKTLKTLCIDVKNLRASPIAVFRVYSDVRKLLKNIKSLIALVSYIPYIYLIVACCTNPVTAVACLVGGAIALYMLFNMKELEPVLNGLGAILNFQKEVYSFLLTRLILRAIQLADIGLHWNKIAPMKMGRSLLTDNLSNKLSFTFDTPIDLDKQSIPKELTPLHKFHPDMEIWTDTDNDREASLISFPTLSMQLHIKEQNGVRRAFVREQPGFWIADISTDRKLESLDFAHLVLENKQGKKKICVVPRSQGRLILQTILKMANSYSRKSVDILSNYVKSPMLKNSDIVYYYDLVDGELASQNFDAISYLITHYITSGDTTRSQKLVDQLKKMKRTRQLENPNAIVKTLEQISSVLPNSINSDLTKIILELSALCTEIPMHSKAFPIFLRAYQHYIATKERSGTTYLSETQESLLARHLQDGGIQGEILSTLRRLALAPQELWVQTLALFANNVVDETFLSSILGKEAYVPNSLKNYELGRKYLKEDSNVVSLLTGLILNNFINPYFSLSKDMVKITNDNLIDKIALFKKLRNSSLNKDTVNVTNGISSKSTDIFDKLPIIISKLNAESSTIKSDYLLALLITLDYLRRYQPPSTVPITQSIINEMPIFQGILSLVRDSLTASLIEPTNFFGVQEKYSKQMQTGFTLLEALLSLILPENLNSTYGVEKPVLPLSTRHVMQSGVTTFQNYVDINKKYKKQQLLRDQYNSTFPQSQIDSEYKNLQTLEKNILGAYQRITNSFLQKQNKPSSAELTVIDKEGSSTKNQIMDIFNWYQTNKDLEASTSSYTIRSSETREALVKSLNKTYQTLQEKTLEQGKTIENLLTQRPQNLLLLTNRIKEYTEDIKNKSDTIEVAHTKIRKTSSNQSTIQKAGQIALGFVNTLIKPPTFGYLQFFKTNEIEQLTKKQSELSEESELIKSKRGQVFRNMINAFKPQTSLGLNEVYDYFCQGKDASIIESLGLDDSQWKILKEQLYRYMILQKNLSSARYINGLSKNTTRTTEENINLIGHELNSMSNSLNTLPVSEMSVRSQLQFEQRLGRSLSPELQDRLKSIVNGSMKNFESIYQFSSSL